VILNAMASSGQKFDRTKYLGGAMETIELARH
jgi:hypothetical protein